MKTSRRVVPIVLAGLLVANVFAYIPYASAQHESVSVMIADADKTYNEILKRYQQMQANMKKMMSMPMTQTEASMAHQMEEMATMIKMLLDLNKKLLDVVKIVGKDRG